MGKIIPYTEDIEFKKEFVERYSKLTDFEAFRKYSLMYLRKSIRVNTIKTTVADVKKRLEGKWKLTPIPWCKEGFWLESDRRDVGNLIEHALGYIYVQEAASMIPPIVLEPKPGERVLDLCAAPGSKTTQIAQYMNNKGILVANDITADRLASLGLNLQRCGVYNTMITMMMGFRIKHPFDRILCDAPCSGTGTIRKSLKTIKMWNPKMVKRLSITQKKLASAAFDNLAEGGTMVYSTCTQEPEENEGVVSYLLDKYDNMKLEKIELDIKKSKPVMEFEGTEFNPEVKKCLRIYPQDNDTEGFFVTRIKKD